MNKFVCALIAALVISVCANTYAEKRAEDLENNIVRLHIIANSDSEADQAVKLKVRDEILENVDINDKYFLENARLCADKVLAQNGFDYSAEANFGKYYFPERDYNGITLPNGEYYGVRITLGKADGHNWWCILYPPMCTQDAKTIEGKIDDETYAVISRGDGKTVVKFRTLELINYIKNKIS